MELSPTLDQILLDHLKEQAQTISETTNTFCVLLEIPRIPLKMKSLKLFFHCANGFVTFDPIGLFFFIILFI